MIRFELLEPADLSEACSLLSANKGNAKIIAGGHGLLPLLKHRMLKPASIVNIKGLSGLDYIKDEGSYISIGALTTNGAVEASPLINEQFPMLTELEHVLGDTQTRNWGTVVGNLCMCSPTSDLAPSLTALGAILKVCSVRGEREIPLEEFFVDFMKTALEADEIVTELKIPKPPARTGGAYHKERVRMTDSPIASGAAVITLDEGLTRITAARVVLQAVCPTPLKAEAAEQVMIGQAVSDELVDRAAQEAAEAACPISDVYGSAEYKKEMVKVVIREVVTKAIERARTA